MPSAPQTTHKLRVCEAFEDIDNPNTRVWEVCDIEIEYRNSGRYHWRGQGTLSSHTTWREAMDAAQTFARQHDG